MIAYWADILTRVWHIKASLIRLDGEYDLNFSVESERGFILKVMREGCQGNFIDMQCQALQSLAQNHPDIPVAKIIPTLKGELYTCVKGPAGEERLVWLQHKVKGVTYSNFKPQSLSLVDHLGQVVGALDKAWQNFEHPALHRDFKWNLTGADWIGNEIAVLADDRPKQKIIETIIADFAAIKAPLMALKSQAIHNDINDYNIIVGGSLTESAKVVGLIDLGDVCASPRICNLAICAAYVVLDEEDPEQVLARLVAGYHSTNPLQTHELDLLWPLLRMRLAVSVINSSLMSKDHPSDPYITISQAPAWRFLLANSVNQELIGTRLKVACGLDISTSASSVLSWLASERGNFAPVLGIDLSTAPMRSLSVECSTCPRNPFDLTAQEAADLGAISAGEKNVWLGYYNEPRLVYTDPAFSKGPFKASNRRTVHIGVDIFAPAGMVVYAPLEAKVVFTQYREANLDYGGLVILSHRTAANDIFYTLYGHLAPESLEELTIGKTLVKGQAFAALGDLTCNGGWNPHLHFQLALSTKGIGDDWPGVADPDDIELYNAICPNPASLLNLADRKTAYQGTSKASVLAQRQAHFADNLKLTYADPVMFLRGWRHHLFDEWGRAYLDSYNNVPHVGHAHPRIQAVAADQLLRINSNTRYLHPAQTAFAKKILSKMPTSLKVCFFVSSGSEANELALRLARAHTSGKEMITPNHGYHGNTTGAIDVSAYKFNASGGSGQVDWVQLVEVADEYRGSFQEDDPDRANKYAGLVDDAIAQIEQKKGVLAGFIAETFPSVAGQIIPPQGYLRGVYSRIRAAGGVCIADEVQTAFGRLGEYYFAFEQQQVVPDIVVMGKPIGNGQPIGVLVTTKKIAASFAQGPEYFATFGGSNLSCRIGKEVLDIVDEEGLMGNALRMGAKLLAGLKTMQKRQPLIGDVRGYGLFIGLDLVTDRLTKAPATLVARYVKNRMREHRILMGTEGPADNILKIRPPLTIAADDVAMLLIVMDKVLAEAQQLKEFSD